MHKGSAHAWDHQSSHFIMCMFDITCRSRGLEDNFLPVAPTGTPGVSMSCVTWWWSSWVSLWVAGEFMRLTGAAACNNRCSCSSSASSSTWPWGDAASGFIWIKDASKLSSTLVVGATAASSSAGFMRLAISLILGSREASWSWMTTKFLSAAAATVRISTPATTTNSWQVAEADWKASRELSDSAASWSSTTNLLSSAAIVFISTLAATTFWWVSEADWKALIELFDPVASWSSTTKLLSSAATVFISMRAATTSWWVSEAE